jgi:hypothetical protein
VPLCHLCSVRTQIILVIEDFVTDNTIEFIFDPSMCAIISRCVWSSRRNVHYIVTVLSGAELGLDRVEEGQGQIL